MPTSIKVGNTYRKISRIYRKNSAGFWVEIKNINVKNTGVFKRVFSRGAYPPEVLTFFNGDETARSGWVSVDYTNRLLMITDSLPGSLITGGSATHYHSSGAANSSTYRYNHDSGADSGSNRIYYYSKYDHYHSITSHTHPAYSNFPQYHSMKVFTNIQTTPIRGIIGLDSGYSYDSNEWEDAGLTKYIGFDTTPGVDGGYSSHTHGYVEWDSGLTGYASLIYHDNKSGNSGHFRLPHRHHIKELLSSVSLNPYYYGIRFLKAKNEEAMLPLGALLFAPHSLSYIPTGFSLVTAVTGRFAKANSSTGTTGGSNLSSHNHSISSTADTYLTPGTGSAWNGNNSTSYYASPYSHSHSSWNHSHTAADATPSYIKLAMLKKVL